MLIKASVTAMGMSIPITKLINDKINALSKYMVGKKIF